MKRQLPEGVEKLEHLPEVFEVKTTPERVQFTVTGPAGDVPRWLAISIATTALLSLGVFLPPGPGAAIGFLVGIPLLVGSVVVAVVHSSRPTRTRIGIVPGGLRWDGETIPWHRVRLLAVTDGDDSRPRSLVLSLHDGSTHTVDVSTHTAPDQHRLLKAIEATWAEMREDPEDAEEIRRAAQDLGDRAG